MQVASVNRPGNIQEVLVSVFAVLRLAVSRPAGDKLCNFAHSSLHIDKVSPTDHVCVSPRQLAICTAPQQLSAAQQPDSLFIYGQWRSVPLQGFPSLEPSSILLKRDRAADYMDVCQVKCHKQEGSCKICFQRGQVGSQPLRQEREQARRS